MSFAERDFHLQVTCVVFVFSNFGDLLYLFLFFLALPTIPLAYIYFGHLWLFLLCCISVLRRGL